LIEFAPISAIVPTKNRPQDLRRTIRTLLRQSLVPSEVIIVDQSADDGSYNAVQEELREATTQVPVLPVVHYVRDPSISGVSAARNHAMTFARDAIWLFLDDDVIIEPDFVSELMQVYTTKEEIDGVSGVITNYQPFPWISRVWTLIFAHGPFVERRLPIYWRADKLRDAGPFRVAGFSGGLMSFRADVARRGHFDPRLSDGEDVDFCLSLSGEPNLVIAPGARLQHMSSPVGRSSNLWIERFAATQSFLYQKHWQGSLGNRICFSWLCVGIRLAAVASGLRRLSTVPWQRTVSAIRTGRNAAKSAPHP
jgi:GT2 family glycosyltransferase